MANTCENTMHFYTTSKENIEYTKEWFNKNLPQGDVVADNDFVDVYFDSKWTFPEELMNKFYQDIPNKDDINIVVLSVEWGCYYCAFHTCDEDGWILE